MYYQSTITSKGQIVIPKKVQKLLGLSANRRVLLEIQPEEKTVRILPASSFLAIAESIHTNKPMDAIKAREQLEKKYERS